MKRKIIIASVLMFVGIVSAFAIIVTSPKYSISTNYAKTQLTLRNEERGSNRLSVSLAVYTSAENACFYPTLTTDGFNSTDTWRAPSGQTIVRWDESAVSCEAPGN